MKAREKLVITISVLACCVAIAIFAVVSLGHFITAPKKPTVPVVNTLFETTVEQVALLEPIPVPAPPTPETKPADTPKETKPKVDIKDKPSDKKRTDTRASDRTRYHNHDKEEFQDYEQLRAFFIAWYQDLQKTEIN